MTTPPEYIMARPSASGGMPQDVIDLIRLGQPGIAAETLARRSNISLMAAHAKIRDWFWAEMRRTENKPVMDANKD